MASSSTTDCSGGETIPVAAEEEERRNWLELPKEVTASILGRLLGKDVLVSVQFVCKAWLEISKDPLVWKRINIASALDTNWMGLDWAKMFYCAVDRSCGQAVDINFDHFGNDDMLNYLTDRGTLIKRLQLICCRRVSEDALIKTVAKLPLLEELEVMHCTFPVPIEAVGRHCPLLKSFKMSSPRFFSLAKYPGKVYDRNEEAVAIGKNMPQLCHLQLVGNSMTGKGLEAILDGCTKLESLDLRQSFYIRYNESLWKRCTDQVKHSMLPSARGFDYGEDSDYSHDCVSSSDDDDNYIGNYGGGDDYSSRGYGDLSDHDWWL